MTLSTKIGDSDNSDRHSADVADIHDFDVYNGQNEKIGKVVKARIADVEHSSSLIIKVGSWLASRQVLVPLRVYRVNFKASRIDIDGWSKEEISQLPTYPIQAQIEDAVTPLETSTALESGATLEAPIAGEMYLSTVLGETVPDETVPGETIRSPQKVPLSASTKNEIETSIESSSTVLDEAIIPLLAERVIVDRRKHKSGEIVIRKVIETEIIEVVVRREKLIVEQVSPEYKELAVIDLGRTSAEETPYF